MILSRFFQQPATALTHRLSTATCGNNSPKFIEINLHVIQAFYFYIARDLFYLHIYYVQMFGCAVCTIYTYYKFAHPRCTDLRQFFSAFATMLLLLLCAACMALNPLFVAAIRLRWWIFFYSSHVSVLTNWCVHVKNAQRGASKRVGGRGDKCNKKE